MSAKEQGGDGSTGEHGEHEPPPEGTRTRKAVRLRERPEGRDTLQTLLREAAQGKRHPPLVRQAIEVYRRSLDAGLVTALARTAEAAGPIVDEPPPWVEWSQGGDELERLGKEPWLNLMLAGVRLARVPQGAYVVVIGPSGSGKSSLTLQMLAEHARDVGPAIYVSHELDIREATARIIGQSCGLSWEDAMCCAVPRERWPDYPRLWQLYDDKATEANLIAAILAAQTKYPDQPVLVAWDHLQATPSDDNERMRVAQLSTRLRKLCKRHRATLLALSQSSRQGSRQLASGERLGADTTDAGAESSQLERDAYLTIALGDMQALDECSKHLAISIGKHRTGRGDLVLQGTYNGLTGRWIVEPKAQTAAEVRATRETEKQAGQVKLAALAVRDALAKASAPLSRRQVELALREQRAGLRRELVYQALRELISAGQVIEVQARRPRGGGWPVWTPDRASAAGLDPVPPGLTPG